MVYPSERSSGSGRLHAGAAAVVISIAAASFSHGAAIDRHPELKSRPVAWTEFDGSYLVNTNSRAEMLDFFWNVFNKPYPNPTWTGSVNPPVAGTTSELWRIREYAQLNAYRALNGSPPMSEDPSKIDYVQAAALVFALNPDRDLNHVIDGAWIGYNATAADAALHSLLGGTNIFPLSGAADGFVKDSGIQNGGLVGHRMTLLHDDSVAGTLGASIFPLGAWIDVWNQPLAVETTELEHFVAYPSPGHFPLALVRGDLDFRWSFSPANDWSAFRAATDSHFYNLAPGVPAKDSTISAKINGVDVPVNSVVRNNPPGPLTWDFGEYLDFANDKVPDGTTVEITVHDVAVETPGRFYITGYRDYQYRVTFLDEKIISTEGFEPRTSLVNLATRSVIGNSDQQMIAGFSVAGETPVRIALRAQGPGLAGYGIHNVANRTHLRVYDSANSMMGENAGWRGHPDWRLLQAFNVAPTTDNEAGMIVTLWPGNYTAVVSDDSGADGIGLVEVFNIDSLSGSKLGNLSTRGVVGTGDNQLIAGVTIRSVSRQVLVRTQGPGLVRYGVAGVVADPRLTIVAQADGHVVAENDDWRSDARNERLTTDLAALAPSDPREAALVLTLAPGAYTALVSAQGDPGVGLVEVFDLTP